MKIVTHILMVVALLSSQPLFSALTNTRGTTSTDSTSSPTGTGTTSSTGSSSVAKYPDFTGSDRDAFANQIQRIIQKDADRFHALSSSVSNGDVLMSDAIRVQMEHAAQMIQVKETLMYNFLTSPSIKSPLVRQKLLNVLNKDDISPGDIADLQNTVVQERPRTEP